MKVFCILPISMYKFLEASMKCTCNYKSEFWVIFTVAILLTQCDAKILRLIEGDEAHLDFEYPCFSTKVTLHMGNKAPFYTSVNQDLSSVPQRYKIEIQNGTESGNCSIYLVINPVKRDDMETFILTAYQGDEILDEYTKRTELRVKYPPGRASCELSQDYRVGEWVSLHCTVPIGTLSGEIRCYQRGMRIPPVATPVQTEQALEQTFWVIKKSYPTFCCTSTQERPVDRCECRDFVWDPSNKTVSNATIDPCPKTALDPSPSHSPGDLTIPVASNLTMTTLANTQRKHTRYLLTILCMFIPLFLIIIIFIVIGCVILVKSKRKDLKNKRLKKNKAKSSLGKAVYMKLPKA